MRDSIADLEKLLTTLTKETNHDRTFLAGMLDHKNATIGWFRERQNADINALNDLYESILARQREDIAALSKLYDDMADTLGKEVALIENHLSTYERGTPK